MAGPYGKMCYNCHYCNKHYGGIDQDFPAIEPALECTNTKVNYSLFEVTACSIYLLPFYCNHYEPLMIENCCNCGNPINKPEYCWPLWSVEIIQSVPVCSKGCIQEMKEKDQKSLHEMLIMEDEDDHLPF